MTTELTKELLASFSQGDETAVGTLRQILDPLLRGILRKEGLGSVADDLVQEAWLVAWQSRDCFDESVSFKKWITSLLRKCISHHRGKEKAQRRAVTAANECAVADERRREQATKRHTVDPFEKDNSDGRCVWIVPASHKAAVVEWGGVCLTWEGLHSGEEGLGDLLDYEILILGPRWDKQVDRFKRSKRAGVVRPIADFIRLGRTVIGLLPGPSFDPLLGVVDAGDANEVGEQGEEAANADAKDRNQDCRAETEALLVRLGGLVMTSTNSFGAKLECAERSFRRYLRRHAPGENRFETLFFPPSERVTPLAFDSRYGGLLAGWHDVGAGRIAVVPFNLRTFGDEDCAELARLGRAVALAAGVVSLRLSFVVSSKGLPNAVRVWRDGVQMSQSLLINGNQAVFLYALLQLSVLSQASDICSEDVVDYMCKLGVRVKASSVVALRSKLAKALREYLSQRRRRPYDLIGYDASAKTFAFTFSLWEQFPFGLEGGVGLQEAAGSQVGTGFGNPSS
jgi:hypothetical protein